MLQHDITFNDKTFRHQLDGKSLKLSEFNGWVSYPSTISIQPSAETRQQVEKARSLVDDAVTNERVVYGVTTGFGGMLDQTIGCEEASLLQTNLLSFLAAGTGPEIDPRHTRGAMLLRANVLLQGKSGVRMELIERLVQFYNSEFVPVVREYGSIGASGDLIPLAAIARAITGHPKVKVRVNGSTTDAASALASIGLEPIQLQAKEGLALVNGTSFSSSISANATVAAKTLLSATFAVQAILMRALQVDIGPFDPFVHRAKPHPGQIWSANTIRELLAAPKQKSNASNNGASGKPNPTKVQDRYSLRCFPQYNGSIVEGIARIQKTVEIEMNSVSDNPLVDPESGEFYHSGNFLGQYLGIAMDDLRKYIALLAKHLDVQIATLVAPEFNNGLSPSLRGNEERSYNMGLKGLQICGNSIMPMLTHQANPIVEHFPTHAEQFNQNVNGLSWGSANLAWKSVQLFQRYLAVASIFAVQAIDLRAKSELGHFDGRALLGDQLAHFYSTLMLSLKSEPGDQRPLLHNDEDRWLEQDIEMLTDHLGCQGDIIKSLRPVSDSYEQFCEAAK